MRGVHGLEVNGYLEEGCYFLFHCGAENLPPLIIFNLGARRFMATQKGIIAFARFFRHLR